jgi:hypothetical protein
MGEVRMINSVGEYIAGMPYVLDDEEADRFILLGYASGELSREYSDEERELVRASVQTVKAAETTIVLPGEEQPP